ncbi:MAG: cytochrome c biogenesis protein ResB [Nitrospirae bacterium]|nr:cytochrome c biogenesis protein ResB [Nitrospirota bacterium]
MNKFKSFLLSRKPVITQISLILSVVLLGYSFPQRFSTSQAVIDKWRGANPALVPWVEKLGLDHVYTTPWFAVILSIFLLTLIISTSDQIKKSFHLTFKKDIFTQKEGTIIHTSEEALVSAIRKKGYINIGTYEAAKRFVKHPWGYCGNMLLHLGLVAIIASSLVLLLTQKRGLLHLVEEEVQEPGKPWTVEENGLLADRFVLPDAIRLDKVNYEFWDSDDLKSLSSDITIIDPQGNSRQYKPGINKIITYKGTRIYQSNTLGHAFFVELIDKEGAEASTILLIEHPRRRDKPGHGSFNVDDLPYPIKANYFADADKKMMTGGNPLLNIMITDDKNKLVNEVSLKLGESGELGPYTARLVYISRWSGLIFVQDPGMSGVFFGFSIIIIGVMLSYFTPPREFLIRKEREGYSLVWIPTKFEKFYEEEFKEICSSFAWSDGK